MTFCFFFKLHVFQRSSPCVAPQVRVPQLQVDGGGQRGLPGATAGLYPPGLSGLRRHLDEAGGQFRQVKTHEQRAGRPGTCKDTKIYFLYAGIVSLARYYTFPVTSCSYIKLTWTHKLIATTLLVYHGKFLPAQNLL